MEVESDGEDDEREDRGEGQPSQPDQDTQVQDMDEVRTDGVINYCGLQAVCVWPVIDLILYVFLLIKWHFF